MLFQLSGLKGLCSAMRRAGISRYKWRFARGPATFEVIFLIDRQPFELLLGAVGTGFATLLRVLPGFVVEPQLPTAHYHALCRALGLTRDPARPFKPTEFFADLNRSVPQVLDLTTGAVEPHDVARYRDDVDHSDGDYFCGWFDNTAVGKKVQPSNLAKTLAVFGAEVHAFCRDRNISTCWSHDPERRKGFELPPPSMG